MRGGPAASARCRGMRREGEQSWTASCERWVPGWEMHPKYPATHL